MQRALVCGVLAGVGGYLLLAWLGVDGILGPVVLGVGGLILGHLWELRKRRSVVRGLAHMLSSTFFHLARVDGPLTEAETRFVRQATLDVTRIFLDWAAAIADAEILDEADFRRQLDAPEDYEAEIDNYARGTLVHLIGRFHPEVTRRLLRVCINLAGVDRPINRSEYEWLEAIQVLANLQSDSGARSMLRAVAP